MYLAFGMVCGILEAQRSGQGQVVDTAMVDGAASLMNMFWSMKAGGFWEPERGTNMLDTGAPFYDVYECNDGLYISCLLYTSPSPRDKRQSRMPSSA